MAVLSGSHPSDTRAAGDLSLDESLGFSDCTIGTGAAALVAQCTTLEVAIDPEEASNLADASAKGSAKGSANGSAEASAGTSAGTIRLAIARIPARRRSERTDAFTLLAGGPGQSAIDSFPMLAFAFRHVMRDHDVILVDQRGTGQSARLSCPEPIEPMGGDFDVDPSRLAEATRDCLASLPHEPRYFTTSVAVQDLELVRQRLGVGQWNLYGISYGTRVAQHYLRRYPDAVRSVVLDAVVPPDEILGPDIAPLAQRALDLIFERCADDPGCHGAFGDIALGTRLLLDSLQEQPRTITYEDVVSGKLKTLEFTRQHLALTLRLLSYSSQTAAILPSILHEAVVNDNLAPLARQSMIQSETLGDTLASGMHHAVVCTEDIPFMADRALEAADSPGSPDTSRPAGSEDGIAPYLGDAIIDALQASCAPWPQGHIDDDFKQPLSSAVPALILSGEADPITPPDYGESVAQGLSNARHLIIPDQGHMQAPLGCMPVLLARFIETTDASLLDTQCLERLSVLPFFVDANGPLP